MKNKLFRLSDVKYLRFFSQYEDFANWGFFDVIQGYWHVDTKKILIYNSVAIECARSLQDRLSLTIHNALFFDENIYSSPGILMNMYYAQGLFTNINIEKDGGSRYCVYSVYKKTFSINSYFYNNKQGEIIFEIGKMFDWPDENSRAIIEEEKRFLSFIADYKPIIKEVIPLEIAKSWLIQAADLEKLILNNTKKAYFNWEKQEKNE